MSDNNIDPAIVERALAAFWASVAESVPQAETGDLDPVLAAVFEQVALETVKVWVRVNVPASEAGPHCLQCLTHPGWAHSDESRRRTEDYCRACYGSGVEQPRTGTCVHCDAEIIEEDGIWYHARIEDFSHIARPKGDQS